MFSIRLSEAKENRIFFWAGGHACGFLFNFSQVTENAIITIKQFFFGKLKFAGWNCSVILISTASLAVD